MTTTDGRLVVKRPSCGQIAIGWSTGRLTSGQPFDHQPPRLTTSRPFDQGLNDFWGRRWNRPVHLFLRRLFFAPALAATGSRPAAAAAAFGASAAMHEALVVWALYKVVKSAAARPNR